ncbi:MAG: hypothetical protein K0Q87_5191 [Neobacillus sp.]|nr:hypothetical protein [Neobacillus sp.]
MQKKETKNNKKTSVKLALADITEVFLFIVTKASDNMVVYHTSRLHKGITNRWTYKFEAAFL